MREPCQDRGYDINTCCDRGPTRYVYHKILLGSKIFDLNGYSNKQNTTLQHKREIIPNSILKTVRKWFPKSDSEKYVYLLYIKSFELIILRYIE